MRNQTSQAAHIIRKFGGVRPMARILSDALSMGEPEPKRMSHTTVQSWKNCGYIPLSQWGLVIDAAAEAGVALEPIDFIAHLIERFERQKKRAPKSQSVAEKELEGVA
jgi:hypothetical protein